MDFRLTHWARQYQMTSRIPSPSLLSQQALFASASAAISFALLRISVLADTHH
jgi:hypothetical protein